MPLLQALSLRHANPKIMQLSSKLRLPGCLRCSSSHIKSKSRRGALVVHANELNKWADIDGGDEDAGLPDDTYDRDTAAVVLRVLTARAVQRVLMQLQELDAIIAGWLHNFVADNPPSAEGSQFLLKLLAQPGKAVTDPSTGCTHTIDPQNLAHRILQVREDMARGVAVGFADFVSLQNTTVLRSHLEKNSYTCGSTEEVHKDRRRGYFRPRRSPKH